MPYIFSTLTNDQEYTIWATSKEKNIMNRAVKKILVKGGHGRMDSKTLLTPMGAVTEVSAADLKELEKLHVFNIHKENGFITVSNSKADPEKVASEMAMRDGSAQKTPADFVNPPKVGSPEDE